MPSKLTKLAVAVALVASLSGTASAQRILRGDLIGGSATADPQQGVYVRDSAIAADKFELGKRMERLKEWHKSADVYQEILEKYQDRVVPTASNEKGQTIQYASVTVAVQERLAKWPEEGLTVYRNRFEPVAATKLEQARPNNLQDLHEIFAAYFVTEAARQAGIRLMDLYMEVGEFSAAAWLGERLLAWHPSLGPERPMVLFRTAVAYHLAGNTNGATRYAEELKAKYGEEPATVAGREVPLAEAIADQLRQRAPIASGSGGGSWRTFGGDESRNLLVQAGGNPGARIYSVDFLGPVTTGLNEQMRDNLLRPYEMARSAGLTINVMPVVDRGELFFQDGWRVYALHLESGVPLSGWAQTYATRGGQYWISSGTNNINFEVVNASQAMLPQQHTVTLTDDAVLAVMGQADVRLNAAVQANQNGGTRLVCLDRATGQERWRVTPRVNPQDQANVRNLAFSGSPLVVGENVYVIARGSSGAGVEECHVYCYALHGGEYKWSAYIASSQTGMFQMGGMPAMLDNDTLSHLAFASGRIFVLTNLGAVAAIDAYSGATAWLTIYPREENDNLARQRMAAAGGGWGVAAVRASSASMRPWEFNPTIVSDGKVFVLPTDSRHVLVYDAGSGRELKRIGRDIEFNEESYRFTMLLGVAGEKLFLAGSPQGAPSSFCCLDWPKAEPQKQNPRSLVEESVLYFSQPPPIKGRPFLTASHLVIPTEANLAIMQLNPENIGRSRTVHSYPKVRGAWDAAEGPGNVVLTPDHVIVANDRNVSVYTDLKGVREKYEAAIRNDPGNVEARLTFAELMYNAREFADAGRVMDEAIDLLGGLQAMRQGPSRDRVFSDAILFAQRAGADKTVESIVRADGLYNRAAFAAHSVAQQVHYRLSRARFIESLKDIQPRPDYATAVRLYQEILSDEQMRAITLAGEQSGPTQAGKVAEAAITDLIRRVGKNVYQPFDQQAAAALQALADTKDANQLLALSEQYPHSSAAAGALMQAAQVYEQHGQPRMATLVLRRLYWKYYDRSTNPERAKLAEAMARNYLKVGNYGAALGRLQRISKLLPNAPLTNALVTLDNKLVGKNGKPPQTVSEAAAALEEFVRQLGPQTLPDVKLPPPLTLEERLARKRPSPPFEARDADGGGGVVANVQAILEPPVELSDRARTDRVVLWSNNRLLCLAGATTKPKWQSNALTERAAAAAWVDGNVLAWGEGEAALVNGETGETLWKADLKGIAAAELVVPGAPANEGAPPADADAEPRAAAAAARPPNAQQQALQRLQEIEVARARAQQEMLMQQQMQQLQLRGARVAVAQPALQPAPAQQPPNDGKERVLHVRPLIDRVILSTSAGRVLAIDLGDGHVIWQTRLSNNPRALQQTLATDDFTVLRMVEPPTAQLVVLDTFSGQQILRKRFSTSQAGWPINCALSPDGTLVWTTGTSMAAKDLYEPGEAPSWERPNGAYANMTQPDQLLIWNQQVLAVCNAGQFVSRRSLRSGDDLPEMNMLHSGNADATTRLRLSGPRLYVISDKSMIAYHLEQETNCKAMVEHYVAVLGAETMLTKDFVVLPALKKPEPHEPPKDLAALDRYLLMAYSRQLVPNAETKRLAESGLQVHRYDFREPAKIKAFHATDGGIFYLAGDDTLHLLRGSRK